MEDFRNKLNLLSLPDEVLIEIFEFFDWNYLQNFLGVCKRFRDLILQTTKLRSKFLLDISEDNIKQMVQLSEQLPFKSINIHIGWNQGRFHEFTEEFKDSIERILLKQQDFLEILKIFHMDNIFFEKILPFFGNVKELRIFGITQAPQAYDPTAIYLNNYQTLQNPKEPINLKKLKVLKIKSDFKIWSLIKAPNLEELIVDDDLYDIKRFLDFSGNLKTLIIDNIDSQDLKNLASMQLRLTKFHLVVKKSCLGNLFYQPEDERIVPNEAGRFLMSQSETLDDVSLDLKNLGGMSSEIIKICLSHLKMSKLSLIIGQKFRGGQDLSVNKFIKELNVEGYLGFGTSAFENLSFVISSCPSVTSLTLNVDMNSDVLSHISTSMLDLKILKINAFFLKNSPNATFEKIEQLKITKSNFYCYSTETWHLIVMTCPNVKKFEITDQNIEISTKGMEEILKNCKNLESLSFKATMKIIFSNELSDIFLVNASKIHRINFSTVFFEAPFHEFFTKLTMETNIHVYCANWFHPGRNVNFEVVEVTDDCSCVGEESELEDIDDFRIATIH